MNQHNLEELKTIFQGEVQNNAIVAANDAVGALNGGRKPGYRDICVAVHAFNQALWQPIETATKSTSHILAWFPESQCTYIIYWHEADSWWRHIGSSGHHTSSAPSHWRPLPYTPKDPAHPRHSESPAKNLFSLTDRRS